MNKKGAFLYWSVCLLLGLFVYFFALDSIHIPNIGDEGVYIQIARKTSENHSWLPLLTEEGINNTKPPLLFWQGIVTTDWGKNWSLWNLRIPVVMTTLLVAFLVGFLVWKISGDKQKGVLSALIYLGFLSTIQHGRPFLMHTSETLFLFIPFVIVLRFKRLNIWRMCLCGLSLGIASLYKSFFLIFAGSFALALILVWESNWKVKSFLRNHGISLFGAVLLALGIFSLWLVFDPRPDLVIQDFFISENLSKFSPAGYMKGLFTGPYTIFRIWLGNLANSGLYMFLIIVLFLDLLKRRRTLSVDEKRLWLYVLGFLIIYSIPSQRQENYILPTCAALSVCLALRWDKLPDWAFRSSHVLVILFVGLGAWFHIGIDQSLKTPIFGLLNYLVLGLVGILALSGLFRVSLGKRLYPALVLGLFLSFSLFLGPFSQSYSQRASQELSGHQVYFPSNFYASYEDFRFILPRADIRGYRGSYQDLSESPRFLAVALDTNQTVPDGYRLIDQILFLKSRHSNEEIKDILFRRNFDLLVQRLAILERVQP
jgi:4-amino-4-deoxy-L-arabinose transferase-like glycosyltransferase